MTKRQPSSLGRILRGVLVGANIATILLLWASVLSTFLPPDRFPRLSLLGLAFPVFLAADCVLLVVWLLCRARMAWLPAVGMLVTGSFVLDYCPVNGHGEVGDSALCVLSYNAGGVADQEARDSFWSYLDRMHPDIVCLQEISPTWFDTDEAKADMQRLHLACLGAKGTYVLSRWPLREAGIDIQYETKGNSSYACWVLHGRDSILVVSNHLESNRLSSEEKDEYRQIIHDPKGNMVRHEGRALAGKLAQAARLRGPQADSLCALVDRYAAYPMLVCGDFNDTPISYTYQRLARCLTSAYRQSGNGMGFSFNQDEFFVRIDHIFLSPRFRSTRTYIDRHIYLSDHYPIVSYLHLRDE